VLSSSSRDAKSKKLPSILDMRPTFEEVTYLFAIFIDLKKG
jgi:hypothetical protein